ncbi:MAG TPA: ABC transporter ATP-binding protein [Candidatus Limnocylindrales bacterium]|nr:ABC transporter ATP-binding protein [Candidatus Limnocylindrales bacterium]
MSVRVEGVSKRFGAVQALADVSLEVRDAEMVALLGPSGCGKTTLLRMIAGLELPDAGRVVIDEAEVTRVPARRRNTGMVFQSYALFPNLTVRDNIGFPLEVRGRPAPDVRARTDELLELLQLTAQGDRYPNQLSGGQQQRAALGRALAPSPAVLLLDEPLSALDALVRSTLRDEIRRVQQQLRITALYVTHDQSEAMAIADRVAVMQHGRIEQIAAPSELYDRPATRFAATFVGSRNAAELAVVDGRVRLGSAFEVTVPAGTTRAVAFFRPEDVELVREGPPIGDSSGSSGVSSGPAAGQPATIEVRLFLGATTRFDLATEVDGGIARLSADIPTRDAAGLDVGARVRFRVAPGLVQVFPVEPGGGA